MKTEVKSEVKEEPFETFEAREQGGMETEAFSNTLWNEKKKKIVQMLMRLWKKYTVFIWPWGLALEKFFVEISRS